MICIICLIPFCVNGGGHNILYYCLLCTKYLILNRSVYPIIGYAVFMYTHYAMNGFFINYV